MAEPYIRLYDWTACIRPIEHRIIYSYILHYTMRGSGFFAGYKALSDLTGIPRSKVKFAVELMEQSGMIVRRRETRARMTAIVMYATEDFAENHQI